MFLSRRQFVAGTSASLLAASVPGKTARAGRAPHDGFSHENTASLDDATLKEVIARGLDAAKSAGASYADVRYRVSHEESWVQWNDHGYPTPFGSSTMGFGIRALYNGYWGYAALGSLATVEGMVAAGNEATAQAKTSAKGKPRTVELAPLPTVANGRWSMPVEIDPFTVSWEEKVDFFEGLLGYLDVQWFAPVGAGIMTFFKEEQTFASTDGAYCTQTVYNSKIGFTTVVAPYWKTEEGGSRDADFVSSAGAGWEYLLNAPIEEQTQRLVKQAQDRSRAKPVDVGRYEVVFDGIALGKLLDVTLGAATELDRAMAYQANTVGTSYLNDPLGMLGSYVVGSPLLTLTANRSMANGAATVRWDDEGVEPDEATLVKDGVLTDFQTTRESATWLAPYYNKIGQPIRSHGGGSCSRVSLPPTQGAHNLVLHSSAADTSFEMLCSEVKQGFAVLGGTSTADQQALNAESAGDVVYEITNGKIGNAVQGAILISRSPELWRNVVALGGAGTVQQTGLDRWRGQDRFAHTVSAPAALVKNIAVTANQRRTI